MDSDADVSNDHLDKEIRHSVAVGKLHPLSIHLWKEGYSLAVPRPPNHLQFTQLIAFSSPALIDQLGKSLIPWQVVPFLELANVSLFYKGCVALRVCDHRTEPESTRLPPPSMTYHKGFFIDARELNLGEINVNHLIILRPSPTMMMQDLANITQHCLGSEDAIDNPKYMKQKLNLEHKFYELHKVHSRCDPHKNLIPMPKKLLKRKYTNGRANSLRLDRFIANCPSLLLGDAISRRISTKQNETANFNQKCHPINDNNRAALEQLFHNYRQQIKTFNLSNHARKRQIDKLQHRRSQTVTNFVEGTITANLVEMEELVIVMPGTASSDKTRTSPTTTHTTTITIFKRSTDRKYFARLILESAGSHIVNGPFILGDEKDAKIYVAQYLEMVTEGGRKQPINVKKNTPLM